MFEFNLSRVNYEERYKHIKNIGSLDMLQHLDDWRRRRKTMLSSSSALGRNYHTVLTQRDPLLIIIGLRTYRCRNMKSYWWKYQSHRQAPLTLSWCQCSTLASGHCLSDNIDMASQHNENVVMPCAAVMMELTESTKLLFVLFRAFDMCQCPRTKEKVFFWMVSIILKHIINSLKTAVAYTSEHWNMC